MGCSSLTAPASSHASLGNGAIPRHQEAQPAVGIAEAAPADQGADEQPDDGVTGEQDAPEAPRFKAAHIVFEYAGSARNNPKVKRSKSEARTRANEIMQLASRPGADFAALARQHSDGESAARGGLIGKLLDADSTDPAIYGALRQLEPGQVSGVVETKWGFHVIQRLE